MAFGAVTFVARFALGLGASTNLSDTYPWGLWILFDLVWIAVAAGAFAMAGIIYVFQRKDLYGLGRTAVLMGLLSYSFVMVTLLADLGLPWNSYQLAIQAPEHSAMFEVSWCVGLYVTVLLLEFLPVPFARWGYEREAALLRRWNGAYVAGAVTLFVYLLSRNLLYALAAAVVFGTLAWMFRARDQHAEPIMLAIAAVTLSTMHQSSLGSLYLLMPNMLAPQWWSPVMPVSFFLSSIAAGTALVILIDMWIAKAWRRPLEMTRLASVGQITFWALVVYLVFRLGDMAIRNQLSGAFSGRLGLAFAAEILLGGVLPLILLAQQVASAAGRRALRGVGARGCRRGLQPHERRPLRDDLPGPDALARGGELRAVDRRVGRFGRSDRRDDLPVRPGRPLYAGALQRRAPRGALSRMTPDRWVEAHAYLRPLADLSAEVDRASAGDRRPRRAHSRLGGLPRGLSRRCAAARERRRRRRSRTGRTDGGRAAREAGRRHLRRETASRLEARALEADLAA